MKSQFEEIVPDDFKLFREIAIRFQKVKMEDVAELNSISVDAWLLACRWNNISSNAKQIAQNYADISKSDFGDWAYHIYSLLKELHISSRSWYNNAVKDYELNKGVNE